MFLLFSHISESQVPSPSLHVGPCRKPHGGNWNITETRGTNASEIRTLHHKCKNNFSQLNRRTNCDCLTVGEKSRALLLIYVFGLHKHTIKTRRDRLWCDGLSLFFLLFTYPPTGRHLLQPRLLMRQMKGTSLPPLPFPSYEKCFFCILLFLAPRTFAFFRDGPISSSWLPSSFPPVVAKRGPAM